MCNFRSLLLLCLFVGRVFEVRSRLWFSEVLCSNYSDDKNTIEASTSMQEQDGSSMSTSVQEQEDASSMSASMTMQTSILLPSESGKINACIITEFIGMI